jgi:hypothetical protein
MISLQAKTVDWFRKEGYVVASVERQKRFPDKRKHRCNLCGNIPLISIKHDLWNSFDLLACRPESLNRPNLVLIQTTDASHHAMRRTKVLTSPEARFWLLAGGSICIQSWQKGTDRRWHSRNEWLSVDDFPRSLPATVPELYESRRREKLPDYPQGAELFKEEEVPF